MGNFDSEQQLRAALFEKAVVPFRHVSPLCQQGLRGTEGQGSEKSLQINIHEES